MNDPAGEKLIRKIAESVDQRLKDRAPVVVPVIETKRLVLRGLRASDAATYAGWVANPTVMKYIGQGKTLSADEAWRKLAFLVGHWQLRGYGQWAVEEKSTGRMVGRAGLHHPHGWPGIEVGWLVDPDCWGRGFAAEAGHAAIDWGFSERNLESIISVIKPENVASIRVAEKIGERFLRNDQIGDIPVVIYGISREEFSE